MSSDPQRRSRKRPAPVESERPKIWAEGEQRARFSMRGLRQATLHLSREAVAPLNAWAARALRRGAVSIAGGTGRIPEANLGRLARFVPSHLRVAAWVRNAGAVLAHASAVADPDVARGNALVAEVEKHLWPDDGGAVPPDMPAPAAGPAPSPFGPDAPPVVLAEPAPEPDPLAAIRGDLEGMPELETEAPGTRGPALTPAPPGPVATMAIQMLGYLVGWATVILALPYGVLRSLWLWLAQNVDLRRVGLDD